MSFFGELTRRNVFRVGIAYLAAAWVLIQVADVVLSNFDSPEWIIQALIFSSALGFPLTLVLAWFYELTPEGIRAASDLEAVEAVRFTGRKIDFAIIGLLVLAVGFLLVRPLADDTTVLPNSVAVLPFENLSPDPNNSFFAAGIHDTILKELAKVRDMNVISRSAMLRYADGRTPIPQIAQELNVQFVMEGSVQYWDDHVLVTVQLIDPRTNANLWSDSYDRPFSDIFMIQADIATRIATALEAQVSPAERESIERPLTSSMEALGLYFRATEGIGNIAESNTEDQVAVFHSYLDQAIALDPDFARAYAFKADRYAEDLEEGFMFPDDAARAERARLAEQYARQALAIDPELGLAHGALAVMYEYTRRTEEAEAAYQRALELSPKDRDTLINYAFFNYRMGRFDESIRAGEQLASVDPLWSTITLTFGHQFARNVDEMEAAARAWNALGWGNGEFLHYQLAMVEHLRGNEAAAAEQARLFEEAFRSSETDASSALDLAYIAGRFGRPEDAQRHFTDFQVLLGDNRISAGEWVKAYLAVGDEARVREQLEILVENREADWSNEVWEVKYNSWADPVLDRLEFAELRSRIGVR